MTSEANDIQPALGSPTWATSYRDNESATTKPRSRLPSISAPMIMNTASNTIDQQSEGRKEIPWLKACTCRWWQCSRVKSVAQAIATMAKIM